MSAEGRTDPVLSGNPKPPLGGGEFTPAEAGRVLEPRAAPQFKSDPQEGSLA
jgi:hypothetical protein